MRLRVPQLHVLHVTLSRSRGIILIIIESESYLLFGNHETWSRLSEWKIVLTCQGCVCQASSFTFLQISFLFHLYKNNKYNSRIATMAMELLKVEQS